MTRGWLCLCAVLLFAGGGQALARSAGVAHRSVTSVGVRVNVVDADLNDPNVQVAAAVSRGFPRRMESWSSFLHRTRPAAAINGTFFDPRGLAPIGDVVVGGKFVHYGAYGSAVCVGARGTVSIFHEGRDARNGWTGYDSILCSGPRLVVGGKVILNPRAEGFRDPHLLGRARRSAVGLTRSNHLLLVTVPRPVTLGQLAFIMSELGAVEALTLDGGASSGLYYRGLTITRPGRALNTFLLVYDDPAAFKKAAPQFASRQLLGPSELVDPSAPKVRFLGVDSGQTVTGRVRLTAAVTNAPRDSFLVLLIDGNRVAMRNTPPYNFTWDAGDALPGEHILSLELRDGHQNVLAADDVAVEVPGEEPAELVAKGGAASR